MFYSKYKGVCQKRHIKSKFGQIYFTLHYLIRNKSDTKSLTKEV